MSQIFHRHTNVYSRLSILAIVAVLVLASTSLAVLNWSGYNTNQGVFVDELRRRQIHVDAVIANYVTPANDCQCDQSMRAHELDNIRELRTENRELRTIERQDQPITGLGALAALFHVASD